LFTASGQKLINRGIDSFMVLAVPKSASCCSVFLFFGVAPSKSVNSFVSFLIFLKCSPSVNKILYDGERI